jgi:hypothetical protein
MREFLLSASRAPKGSYCKPPEYDSEAGCASNPRYPELAGCVLPVLTDKSSRSYHGKHQKESACDLQPKLPQHPPALTRGHPEARPYG